MMMMTLHRLAGLTVVLSLLSGAVCHDVAEHNAHHNVLPRQQFLDTLTSSSSASGEGAFTIETINPSSTDIMSIQTDTIMSLTPTILLTNPIRPSETPLPTGTSNNHTVSSASPSSSSSSTPAAAVGLPSAGGAAAAGGVVAALAGMMFL